MRRNCGEDEDDEVPKDDTLKIKSTFSVTEPFNALLSLIKIKMKLIYTFNELDEYTERNFNGNIY